jgi:hypothetical protein
MARLSGAAQEGAGWGRLPFICAWIRVTGHGLEEMWHFFCFFLFSFFLPCIIGVYFYIFLFLRVTKALPRLMTYRLKGKKGVCHLIAIKTMDAALTTNAQVNNCIHANRA